MKRKKHTVVQVQKDGEHIALISKKVQRKSNSFVLILFGLLLNIFGAALLYWKSQMDKDVIKYEIDKKLSEYGIGQNATINVTVEEIEGEEPSSILLVIVTMLGRMANVVGTIKLFKGLEMFLSDRRKKKLKETAEKLQGGETEADWTEICGECCGAFAF